jgi:hypothetical protein
MKSKIIEDPQMFSYPTCKTGKVKTKKEPGKSKEEMQMTLHSIALLINDASS